MLRFALAEAIFMEIQNVKKALLNYEEILIKTTWLIQMLCCFWSSVSCLIRSATHLSAAPSEDSTPSDW